ncbi:MAG TPA: hypothetical protein VNJ53_11330 [Gaiellaceae bacterium]|nr:hypothetical protein [Gaiellaceae bacterium]
MERAAPLVALVAGFVAVGSACVALGLETSARAEGGSPSAPRVSISRPQRPSSYAEPRNAIRVSTAPQLAAALHRTTPTTILLAPGTYDATEPFRNEHGHRLIGRELGRSVLAAGLVLGGNFGADRPEVRGLTFDIRDPAKTFQSSAVNVWGRAGRRARILDTVIKGNRVLASGVLVRQPDGLLVRRVVIRDVTDYGVHVQYYAPTHFSYVPDTTPRVEDIDIAGVKRAPVGSSDGTAEAGIWAGTRIELRRVRIREVGWAGIWTGARCDDSVLEDLDIDAVRGARVGIYIEHYTRRTVFRRFLLRARVHTGIKTEWADPAYEGTNPVPGESLAASHHNVFEDGEIRSSWDGVAMYNSVRNVIRRVRFARQRGAAIRDWGGVGNAWSGNDYRGLHPGALTVDRRHANDVP